jgi:hypothetical protein
MSSAFERKFEPSALPFTPQMVNDSTRTSSLQDTPWSKGSGSRSGFCIRHTQDDYKPYLKEDLECCRASITFDQFLRHILRVPPEWRLQQKQSIETIVNSKRYQDMLPRYTSQIHHEAERYHPFTELVNHVMEKLRGREEFVVAFCRNDPIIIKGSYAQRKPDCTGVENDVVNEGERGGVDDLSKGGPVRNAFFWTDLVSFLEFKIKALVLNARKTSLSEKTSLGSSTFCCHFFLLWADQRFRPFRIKLSRLSATSTIYLGSEPKSYTNPIDQTPLQGYICSIRTRD